PPGYVQLVLCPSKDVPFFLEIPINIVTSLCKTPRKYLRYLGWCVLGVEGNLADKKGRPVPLNKRSLAGEDVYQYIVSGDPLAHAVDLEVIKQQTPVSSETTENDGEFSRQLLSRDGQCAWSACVGVGMHVIPFKRAMSQFGGLQWLQLIVQNRPHSEAGLDSLTVDDIRNGIRGNHVILAYFDLRHIAVLKTPNPILEVADIPERYIRKLRPGLSYPANARYTLQWLTPARLEMDTVPNNNDAAFKDHTLPKPSDVLLHYNYGAAAVKHWGKNIGVLADRPGVPRPSAPAPAPIGPESTRHNDSGKVEKRDATRAHSQEKPGPSKKKKTHGGAQDADSEVQHGWDEDDVMLFFWGNSKVARERRARE
ncbi:hypothetical protein M413DRAFT_36366, partial [Hebeloma cylindrosporum]